MTDKAEMLLTGRDIRKTFQSGRGWLRRTDQTVALNGVDIQVRRGEILGIVGESGSGKSTLARVLVGLTHADGGSLELDGHTLFAPGTPPLPPVRRGIQMVFQDPYASLNPRMRVGDVVGEGLAIAGCPRSEVRTRIAEMLELVGLSRRDALKYPFQFSGGQRQRICVARALVMQPPLLIADEAVSALDVSVQMQILNLFLDLRDQLGVSIVFITHDIAVVEYLCDRVMVMYGGEVVEQGATNALIDAPKHVYSQKLIAAVPKMIHIPPPSFFGK